MSRFRILLAAVVVFGLALGAAGTAFYLEFERDLPSFETLADYRPELTSTVFDRHGRPIGEFYEHRRQLTPLEDVPELVVGAFLAAEDDTFYEHGGVDYSSIVRAAWANLRAGGESVQGASTITQQTVKQLLLSSERTYTRKIRELILARRIEQRFSKDEILYLYLNQIYFGAGAYGIGEASRTYFGKSIGEIDVSEAALLAGLPKAPGRNSPYLNPERAEQRRVYVLDRMREEGFLTAAGHAAAVERRPPLQRRKSGGDSAAPYVTEEVRRMLVALLGNDLVLHGGLRIETSIDLDLQRAAVAALRSGLEALDRRRGYRGPLRHLEDLETSGPTDFLEALAVENGLGEDPDAVPSGALHALVLDVEKERARIALAPGMDAELRLEDLSWARPEGEDRRREVKDLTRVFSRGDVVPVTLAEGEAEEGALPRAVLVQHPEAQGALLSFEVETGDILAMVGGYDFEDSEFNRTTQAARQPGSAFKPIVYAAALGRGYTPASILYDRPVVIESEGFTWRPENYGRKFLGPILLGEALARSVNNATIHLLQDVGIDYVMEFSRQLGIEAPLERNLGLALGSNPLTLLEITRAYGTFAAGGRRVEPLLIHRVLDRKGQLLLEALTLAGPNEEPPAVPEPPATPEEGDLPEGYAMPPQQAYLASSLLRLVVEHPRGTGRRARSLGRPLAGKTGTTNDQGDAWFVGFSPDVATGVWVGFDEKRVLGRGETGGRAALPIWIEFMGAALAGRPVRDFAVPEGIVFARIDGENGLLASSASEQTLFQAFAEGTEPTERADRAITVSKERRRLQQDL